MNTRRTHAVKRIAKRIVAMGFRPPYSDDPQHPDNWAAPSDDAPVRAFVTFSPDTTVEQGEAAMVELRRLLDVDSQGAKIERAFVY